jgi:serine phosphatase RsbU (regulator of sigma subunit)
MFGQTRLVELLNSRRADSAAEIVEFAMRSLFQFTGSDQPQDDLTLVIIKKA